MNGVQIALLLLAEADITIREMELWGGLLDDIQADINKGVSVPCYVGTYLKQRAENGHAEAPGCGLTEDGWLRDKLLAYTACNCPGSWV